MGNGKRWIGGDTKRKYIKKLLDRDGSQCAYCGYRMFFGYGYENALVCGSIDHIKRREHGGTRLDLDNMRLIHRYCHEYINGERLWDKNELLSLLAATNEFVIWCKPKSGQHFTILPLKTKALLI